MCDLACAIIIFKKNDKLARTIKKKFVICRYWYKIVSRQKGPDSWAAKFLRIQRQIRDVFVYTNLNILNCAL